MKVAQNSASIRAPDKSGFYIVRTLLDAITFSDREIKMTLNNGRKKKINLNFIFLPQRDIVREFFETLREKDESNRTTDIAECSEH